MPSPRETWAGETVVPAPLVTADGATRVDTLCIDVPPQRFQEECSFWSGLTGWEAAPARVPGYGYPDRPAGKPLPVRLLLQRLDAAPPGQPAARTPTLAAGTSEDVLAIRCIARPRRPSTVPK